MRLLITLILCILIGCKKEIEFKPINYKITFTLDSVLTQTGKNSLPYSNGFYYLKLDSTRFQTLSRITGTFLVNDKPNQSLEGNINWEGSHYILVNSGDTISKIIKTYFNPYTGTLQKIQLPSLISQSQTLISVVNGTSIPDFETGKINTMMGPTFKMKGDTITIIGTAKWFANNKIDSIKKSVRIICE